MTESLHVCKLKLKKDSLTFVKHLIALHVNMPYSKLQSITWLYIYIYIFIIKQQLAHWVISMCVKSKRQLMWLQIKTESAIKYILKHSPSLE